MGYNLRMQRHSQCHSCHIIQFYNLLSSCRVFYMHSGLKSEKWVPHIAHEPVIIDKRGHRSVSQGEGVFGRLCPLNVIDTVSAVVIASDDNWTDKLLCAFVLKTLTTSLVNQVPTADKQVFETAGLSNWHHCTDFCILIIVIMSLKFSMHLNFLLQMRCNTKPSELPFCLVGCFPRPHSH